MIIDKMEDFLLINKSCSRSATWVREKRRRSGRTCWMSASSSFKRWSERTEVCRKFAVVIDPFAIRTILHLPSIPSGHRRQYRPLNGRGGWRSRGGADRSLSSASVGREERGLKGPTVGSGSESIPAAAGDAGRLGGVEENS
jgi:hypothetical protein